MSQLPTAVTSAPDDAERLRQLGYVQELRRSMGALDNVAMGFAAISPVVALYGVVAVGMSVAGGAWLWMLPVAFLGQCLLLAVYSELASEYPVANGTYQWSRRLLGPVYGWMNGWVTLCAYAVANTTIAYLGAPWALATIDVPPTPRRLVITGTVLVVICALVNVRGISFLTRVVRAGIGAEVLSTVGIGMVLLLAFRHQDLSVLGEMFGAESLSGGSIVAATLAALAVGGWVFIGFDACGLTAEETHGAAHRVPRTIWIAMLSVAAIVILNAFALTLAHPQPQAVVAGEDLDPVTTAVVSSFGSWADRPFAIVTLIAFLSCGVAAQGMTARAIYSVARDGVLPGASFLRSVDRRQVPIGATAATAVIACLGLLLGLDASAIGSAITFGTAGIYVSFLLVALAALIARLRGTWRPAGAVRLGRAGLILNGLAVAWLTFETINIAWPRSSLAPPDAPWYQVWAATLVLAVIGFFGVAYLLVAKPHRRIPGLASEVPLRSGDGDPRPDV